MKLHPVVLGFCVSVVLFKQLGICAEPQAEIEALLSAHAYDNAITYVMSLPTRSKESQELKKRFTATAMPTIYFLKHCFKLENMDTSNQTKRKEAIDYYKTVVRPLEDRMPPRLPFSKGMVDYVNGRRRFLFFW